MTVLEFEAFVSEHYEELCGKAKMVGMQRDALHDVVEGMLSAPERIEPLVESELMGWFVSAMRHDKMDELRHENAQRRLGEEFAASVKTLGEADTYADTSRRKWHLEAAGRPRKSSAPIAPSVDELKHTCKPRETASTACAACNARRKERRREQKAETLEGLQVSWITGPAGNVRWRFQQLRDGRLFDERAVRSLADSMHRASERIRHFGEPGYSYTEFGQEVTR